MHTGDLAVMDDDGYLNIVGRIKDMVIRGGENVYPREIEEFLYTHPDIVDAQVIGVPDERYGEELMAWVRLREGAEPLTAEALREFCAGKLAHYKVPRYVKVVDEFPMTVTGKIRKVEMRAGLGRGARPAGRRRGQERLKGRLIGHEGRPQALALEDDAGVSRTISLDSRLPTTTQIRAASPSLMASAIFGSDGREQVLGEPAEGVPPAGGELHQRVVRVGLEQHEHRVDHDQRGDDRAHHPDDVARSEKTRAEPVLAMRVMIAADPRSATRRAQVRPVAQGTTSARWSDSGSAHRLGRPGRPQPAPDQHVVELRGGACDREGRGGRDRAQAGDPGRLRAAAC